MHDETKANHSADEAAVRAVYQQFMDGWTQAITGNEGMIGEVGTVKSPVGMEPEGWVLVHGERWRAVLAFAPEEADPIDAKALIGIGRKVMVVGFGDGSVLQVVPIELPGRGSDLDRAG